MVAEPLESGVITLDSSGILALANAKDADFSRCHGVLAGDRGPFLIPTGILSEIAYLLEARLGARFVVALLTDIEDGHFVLDNGDRDIPRVCALVQRYADMPLGYADAAVIACAERHAGRVLTLDLRHFGVMAPEGTITLLP